MSAQLLYVTDGSLCPVDRVTDAAQRAGITLDVSQDSTLALDQLRHKPCAAVLDAHSAEAESFMTRLHADRMLSALPVLALVREASDGAFGAPLAWGVDEVLPIQGIGQIAPIATALSSRELAARPQATQGTVLLAFSNADDRRHRARSLRNVGFEVRFAADPDELAGSLAAADVKFVLADATLFAGDPLRALRGLYDADPLHRPWVLVTPGPQVAALARDARGMPVEVLSRLAPPEDALFAGNELLRAGLANQRASARLLHATLVQFRELGELESRYGVSYNISREGIYVRTIAPPPRGAKLWAELRPPGSTQFVHLEVEVMWNRAYRALSGATAPAGFGAIVRDATYGSRARWNQGYAKLLSP